MCRVTDTEGLGARLLLTPMNFPFFLQFHHWFLVTMEPNFPLQHILYTVHTECRSEESGCMMTGTNTQYLLSKTSEDVNRSVIENPGKQVFRLLLLVL